MSKVLITDTTMTDIADAIRDKTASIDTMLPSEMSEKIESIKTFSDLGFTKFPLPYKDDYDAAINLERNWDASSTSINFSDSNATKIIPSLPLDNAVYAEEAARGNYLVQSVAPLYIPNLVYASQMFVGCTNLIYVESMYLPKVEDVSEMFVGCTNLKDIGIIDFHNSSPNMWHMFEGCTNLTSDSVNNIMLSCLTVDSSEMSQLDKTLQRLFGDDIYTISGRINIYNLPSYQDFVDAGWDIYNE